MTKNEAKSAIIETHSKVGVWIPVTDRRPEYDGLYLCCFDDGFITTVALKTDCKQKQDWELWADSGDVVAWQPLPEPYHFGDVNKMVEMEWEQK